VGGTIKAARIGASSKLAVVDDASSHGAVSSGAAASSAGPTRLRALSPASHQSAHAALLTNISPGRYRRTGPGEGMRLRLSPLPLPWSGNVDKTWALLPLKLPPAVPQGLSVNHGTVVTAAALPATVAAAATGVAALVLEFGCHPPRQAVILPMTSGAAPVPALAFVEALVGAAPLGILIVDTGVAAVCADGHVLSIDRKAAVPTVGGLRRLGTVLSSACFAPTPAAAAAGAVLRAAARAAC